MLPNILPIHDNELSKDIFVSTLVTVFIYLSLLGLLQEFHHTRMTLIYYLEYLPSCCTFYTEVNCTVIGQLQRNI
jgi:hypothetical protein